MELVEDFADMLAGTNPRFDRARFVKASTIRLLDLSSYAANKVARAHGLV